MIREIYLDMDDVLNRFHHAIWQFFRIPSTVPFDPAYGWDMVGMVNEIKGTNYSVPEFWDKLHPQFWYDIPKSEHCDLLIQTCIDRVGVDNVYIATSPTKCSPSMAKKHEWLVDNLPESVHRQFFITPRKWKLGAEGRLLIDDCQANCEKFMYHDGDGAPTGGDAIVFPAAWNNEHEQTDPIGYVLERLNEKFPSKIA